MKKKVEFFPFVKTILFSPIIWKITCVCYNMFNLNIYFCLFSDHIRTSIISSKLLFYGLLQRFGIMSTTMQPIDCCNSLRIISNFLLSSRSPTMAPPLPKSWKNSLIWLSRFPRNYLLCCQFWRENSNANSICVIFGVKIQLMR